MCVVSNVMDDWSDRWRPDRTQPWVAPHYPWVPTTTSDGTGITIQPQVTPPTKEEVDEFRELLKRARQWDIEHNEPDCESATKKALLRDIAEHWGLDIEFVDEVD